MWWFLLVAHAASPEAWQGRVARHEAAGRPERALAVADRWVRAEGDVDALLTRARLHEALDDGNAALADYAAAMAGTTGPRRVSIGMRRAHLAWSLGLRDEAIDLVTRLLAEDEGLPEADRVAHRLTVARWVGGTAARPWLDAAQALATTPATRAPVFAASARWWLEAGDPGQATDAARTALGLLGDPPSDPAVAARAHHVLALVAEDLASADAAQGRAVAAWERTPDRDAQGKAWKDWALLAERAGRYAIARERTEVALERSGGDAAPGAASLLFALARTSTRLDDLDAAEAYYARALAAAERDEGPRSAQVATLLSGRATLLHRRGRYDEARASVLEALRIHEAAGGPSEARTSMLHNLATIERALGRYDEALDHFDTVLARVTPGSLDEAVALEEKADVLSDLGRPAEAEPLFRRALEIWTEHLGPDHPDVGIATASLAANQRVLGRYDEATALYDRAIAIAPSPIAALHPRLGQALCHLGAGRTATARELLDTLIADQIRLLGPDHPDLATPLLHLADLDVAAGLHRKARDRVRRALRLLVPHLGPDHPTVVASRIRLAGIAVLRGDLTAARAGYDDALRSLEAALGPDALPIAHVLGRRSHARLLARDLVGAREDADRALDVTRAAVGDAHPDTAVAYNNRALVRLAQGDADGAVVDIRKALDIWTATVGPAHPDTATGLNNGAAALEDLGRLEEARDLYLTAIARWEALDGGEHPDAARAHVSVASVLIRLDDLDGAAAHLRRALEIQAAVYDADHPEIARTLDAQAELARARGDLQRAETLLRQNLRLRERTWGPDHPALASSWENLAILALDAGDLDAAARRAERALAIVSADVRTLLEHGSERERLRLVADRRRLVDLWLATHPEAEAEAHAVLRRWKGAVRLALASERRALARTDDPGLQDLADRLATTRARIASLRLLTPDPEEVADRKRALTALSEEAERLERALAGALPAPPTDVGLEDLCAALGTDALVDVVWWTHPGDDTPRVDAFVIPGDRCAVTRIPLGPAEPIERAIARYRRAVRSGALDAAFFDGPATRVRELVWDPVAPVVGDAEVVWIVPDGPLSTVSFAGLPQGDRYLVEDRAFGYLDAAVALLPDGDGLTDAAGAVVVGGVDYGSVDPDTARGGCAFQRFGPLPGTAREASDVAARLSAHLGADAVATLSGTAATEAAVARSLSGRRFVHLATHGFFATGRCRNALDAGGVPSTAGFHPMTLSGLAFAGANRGDGDGTWTAAEVSALDLSGTELVVLSACDTGLGEIETGEGVLGLRRAFALSGARSLVMSLWPVDDAATVPLMDTLYARLLDGGRPPVLALRDAQLARLAASRRAGDPRPATWSAFIAGR